MSIESGCKLGPYEILSLIGAGGMGEVYKAKDTRLDRIVAIKVLPSHFADHPERRERFEREARAVAGLNHPHICTLHDIGEHEGTHFLVMEYIEGETLADRLKKGPLPLEEALRYATEIADALDKAPREGVVHRDFKPGNVMLAKPGAKLLDFGLAKFKTAPAQEGSVLSALPTEEKPLTEKGSILGTFQYMAPEQLEGKDVDARSDIFAFGSVLYEMLTGKRAFEGDSQASLIGAILKDDPPLPSELQAMSPPLLDRVVKKCLAKDPQDRWHTTDGDRFLYYSRGKQGAMDGGVYLASLDSGDTELIFSLPPSPMVYAPPGFLLFVKDGNLMAQPFDAGRAETTGEAIPIGSDVSAREGFSVSETGVLVYSGRTRGPEISEMAWFDRSGRRLQTVGEPDRYVEIELSPNDTHLALERHDPETENYDIWQLELSHEVYSRLTYTPAGDAIPRWAEDGERISFQSYRVGNEYYQVFSNGSGDPELLFADTTLSIMCDWSADGRNIVIGREGDLYLLSLYGNKESIPLLSSQFYEYHGRFSPDGRFFAYGSNETGRYEVYVTTFPEPSTKWRISREGGDFPRWRSDGKELFYISAQNQLMAVNLSLDSELATDVPEKLPITVRPGFGNRYWYDVASDGERILVLTAQEGAGPQPFTVVLNWHQELLEKVPVK